MNKIEVSRNRTSPAPPHGERDRARPLRRFRIQHVIGSFRVGGAERYALQLARSQAQSGHAVYVAALDDGPLVEEFRDQGFALDTVPKKAGLDLSLPLRLTRLFLKNDVAVVHTHNPPPLVYASLAARAVGAALVHTKHGVNVDLRRRIWLRSMAARLVHRMVAVSDDTAGHAIEQGEARPDRYHVIRNGVDADEYRPRPDARERVRAELGIGSNEWVIGSVGRLVPEKHHALLLRAAAPLVRDGRGRLLLIGDGPERAALVALARDLGVDGRVILAGIRRDTPQLLSAMDVFAVTSRTEGLPLALLEAMATGLPVVCTRVGGIPELLEGRDAGRLVAPEDEAGLARELARLRDDPHGAKQMGERARQLVIASHGLGAAAAETTALYRSAVLELEASRAARVLRLGRSPRR